MKCTACHAPVKPVVAIDIDGTLGDYHSHFLAFADEYLGKSSAHMYTGYLPFKDWFRQMYKVDDRTWKDIKLAYRQGAMKRSMPLFDGAGELTDAVQAANAELWLTTTRPYMRLDNVDPDTRAWLERHRIGYDHMIYDDEKYPLLAELVGADRVVAVLDDLAEQLHSASAVFGAQVPIMRGTQYNRKVHGVSTFRVYDLHEAKNLIVDRIEQWRAMHD